MHVYNHKGMKVPGMIQDGGALPKAYVGGAIKQVIKGVPKSLKRLLTGKSNLKSEARRVKNTFKNKKEAMKQRKFWNNLSDKDYKKYYKQYPTDW
tara:strand:- start:1206 stop:1490 length:285 start_codon:yes stop_codon:yes gene_type:complete